MSDAGPSPPALYVSGVTSAMFERQEVHMPLVQNRCSSQFPVTEYTDILHVDLDVKIN
jgi:hypothetical protein